MFTKTHFGCFCCCSWDRRFGETFDEPFILVLPFSFVVSSGPAPISLDFFCFTHLRCMEQLVFYAKCSKKESENVCFYFSLLCSFLFLSFYWCYFFSSHILIPFRFCHFPRKISRCFTLKRTPYFPLAVLFLQSHIPTTSILLKGNLEQIW